MSVSHVQPWHAVMELREEIRSGDLSLAFFAADLTKAVMGEGPYVYRDPKEFFALTYPTANLKKLARDVVLRLARSSDKAVRQLELTYGGGKTHTLLTLYHLVHAPASLPDKLPAVREFINSIGRRPPETRVGFVGFDKLDLVKGMVAKAPTGEARTFRYPWSVLAWQLAGEAGLAAIGSVNEERTSPPFANVLQDSLFPLVLKEDRAILLLMDEVLMWAVEKVREDEGWLDALQNFFQSLSNAVTATSGAAMVVSLLASDTQYNEGIGPRVAQRLGDVLRRDQEEPIQPVEKEDVAEVLRRRLFTAASYTNTEVARPQVAAAVAGIATLDDSTEKNRDAVEKKFRPSYPFDPNLTEVFYQKWTQLSGFQRTRGVLRTFALALRDAATWDTSPLVGPAVFLSRKGTAGLSESVRELVEVANKEATEGRKQDWGSILQGELEKARSVQDDFTLLKHRELEQAVVGTFLHSQPPSQKATLAELHRLVGQGYPDRIQLEKALVAWARASWFLDEEGIGDAGQDGVPRTWRLGEAPNLKQLHDDCFDKVRGEVEPQLLEALKKVKPLFDVPQGLGIRVHKFPASPSDVSDDTDFHFLVLGPSAASDPGKPSDEAVSYIQETTSADRPRTNRNLMIVAVPSKAGLASARDAVQTYLAWERVALELAGKELDAIRATKLKLERDASLKAIPDRVRQAWCIGVTLDKAGKSAAWQVTPDTKSLFGVFQADARFRIQADAVNAEALLPGGPYDVWTRGDHTTRYLRDIVEAFAQWPEMPKILRPEAVRDTLCAACKGGLVVLRLKRPDGSYRTWWREDVADSDLREKEIQVSLPEVAELTSIRATLLAKDELPGLWSSDRTSADQMRAYFVGGKVVQVKTVSGYEEPRLIPRASPQIVDAAIRDAVAAGKIWLLSGTASLWHESIPESLELTGAELRTPPPLITPEHFSPKKLPEAWGNGETTAAALFAALSTEAGVTLPWPRVSADISGAVSARVLARTTGGWPCDWDQAGQARFKVPQGPPPPPPPPRPQTQGKPSGMSRMSPTQLGLLADCLPQLTELSLKHGLEMEFVVRFEVAEKTTDTALAELNALLEAEDIGFKVKRERD